MKEQVKLVFVEKDLEHFRCEFEQWIPNSTEKEIFAVVKIETTVTTLPQVGYDEINFSWNMFCQCFSVVAFYMEKTFYNVVHASYEVSY